MNFSERVQVYGTKDGIQEYLGTMTRDPFDVLLHALADCATWFGAEDDDDGTIAESMKPILTEFRRHLAESGALQPLNLDFQEKAAQ